LLEHGIAQQRRGRVRLRVAEFDPQEVSLEREEHRRAYERSRLDMMRAYAELRECRRRYILNYFGEEPEWQSCGTCDVDLAQMGSVAEHPATGSPFAPRDRVKHPYLGEGVVQRVTSHALTVLFDSAGYKTLDPQIVQDQELLKKLPT
jgi:ATP-dependent DNA helicase RecQ